MEDKWIVACILGFVTVMFAPLGIMEYNKAQCRIEAIKASVPADDILKVCGK
jgi:hypothetical protein